METDKAAESLRALASTDENRSKIGRLRELLPYIENAKEAGVSMEKILETLNANGLQMKMASFKSMLHRIRSKQGTTPAAKAASPTPKRESKGEAGQVQTNTGQSESPAPAGKKVGEPKRFAWDPTKSDKPEW